MTHNMKKGREQNAQAICKYDAVFLLSIICAEMGAKLMRNNALNKALSIHYKQNAFSMLIANANTTLSKAVLKRNNTKAEIR